MTQEQNKLGPFFGSEIDSEHADIISIQHIDQKLMKKEPELMGQKWFEYRHMHPTVATYKLAHEYITGYKEMLRKAFDSDRAAYAKGIKQLDFTLSKEKNSIWKLRQRIDSTGIRYDFFIRHAMEFCILSGWHQPPRPSHIYSNDDMIVYVLNKWHEECAAKIQYPESEHFQTANWVGSKDQLEYEEWLIEQIKRRPNPQFALSAAIHEMGVLRIEAALEHFPPETVLAAINFASYD